MENIGTLIELALSDYSNFVTITNNRYAKVIANLTDNYLRMDKDNGVIILFKPDKIIRIIHPETTIANAKIIEPHGIVFGDELCRDILTVTSQELEKIRKILEKNERYDILMKVGL
jgi:hypothetical protein